MIPYPEIINIVTISQAAIGVVIVLFSTLRRNFPAQILGLFLLIFALIKADQIFQFLDGPLQYPHLAFWLSPLEWLLTPVLYFYVLSLSIPDFRLRWSHVLHLCPALLWFGYQSATFLFLPSEAKITILNAGTLREPLHSLWIPLISDAIQLSYIGAAVSRLHTHGQSLRDWFSRIEDRDLRWIRNLLALWTAIVACHALFFIARSYVSPGIWARFFVDLLNTMHMVFAIALVYRGLAHALVGPATPQSVLPTEKYAHSTLSHEERAALYERAQARMLSDELYRNGDLSLDELAIALNATERELSEALNGVGQMRFFEFVNRFRIVEASRLLLEYPDRSILEVGFEAGFNSKSTFNAIFKAYTSETPTQFRKRHGE